ncbi:MAG TPA: hypothetical protein VFV13_00695 [Acidimicrobiia bacterium]|nr:hypothetical protein [Acidimicrobiia bacterium]
MQRVALSTGEWGAMAYFARTFTDRLLGVWRVPDGSTVVLPVSTVHGFGRRQALDIVGLDAAMRVISTSRLEPNRIIVMPGARMIIETPAGGVLPALGDRVELTHA